MDHQYDGSADVMMIMAGVLVVLLAIFIPLAQLEKLTYIENQGKQAQQDAMAPDMRNVALLEVEYRGVDQLPIFHWRATEKGATTTTTDYAEVRVAIEAGHPDAIRLRIDRRVASGIFQDLVIDASNLGIPLWQSNQ